MLPDDEYNFRHLGDILRKVIDDLRRKMERPPDDGWEPIVEWAPP